MTTFYRFADRDAFIAAGGLDLSEYTADGIGYSVIGDHFEPEPDPLPEEYVPVYVGFLVNTTKPIDAWVDMLVTPSIPMRIFG